MGGGGTTSTTSSTSSEWPSWAEGFGRKIGAAGENWLSQYGAAGDSPLKTAAEANLAKYQSADFLNPDNDPTLAGQVAAITRSGNEAFKMNDANLAGQAAEAGGLLSTKTAAARALQARNSAADIAGKIADLRAGIYKDRLGLQANSVASALTQGDDALSKAFQAASIVRGTGGSSSSTTNTKNAGGFLGLF